MTTKIDELEVKLFEYLENNQGIRGKTFKEIMDFLHCKTQNLRNIIKKHKRTKSNPNGLININKKEQDDNLIYYHYEISEFMKYFKSTLPKIELAHVKSNSDLRELRKFRPIFKNAKIKIIPFKTIDGKITKIESITFDNPNTKIANILDRFITFITYLQTVGFSILLLNHNLPPNEKREATSFQDTVLKYFIFNYSHLNKVIGKNELQKQALDSYFKTHNPLMQKIKIVTDLDLKARRDAYDGRAHTKNKNNY